MRNTGGAAMLAVLTFLPSVAPAQVFTPAEQQTILDAHNQVRCAVNPAAQVMPALTWDAALELMAQTWASGCVDGNGDSFIDHNPIRNDPRWSWVGENIYAAGGPLPGMIVAQPTWAVQGWASEKAYYNLASNTCTPPPGKVCGHYTQLVWATTLKVGCARSFCPNLDYDSVIVCNYGPGGNTGGPPYQAGSGVNAACGSDLIFAAGFES